MCDQLFDQFIRTFKHNHDTKPFSEEQERSSFVSMKADVDKESNPAIKAYLLEALEAYCKDGGMLLSYIHEQLWRANADKQRTLLKTLYPMGVYKALADIAICEIDSSGYTGGIPYSSRWRFTFPGAFPEDGGGRSVRTQRSIDESISALDFFRSYIAFGVHKYPVGEVITNTLRCLEERYGLNFEYLERERIKSKQR